MSALAVPLDAERIQRSGRLREHVLGWVASDRALSDLADRFPDFGGSAVLLKTVAINSLYFTNVYAVVAVARHIESVLAQTDSRGAGPELVERLAAPALSGRPRRFRSFAAKFAHFFIDAERFPMLDGHAERMVRLHLGARNSHRDDAHRYVAFVRNFQILKQLAGWSGTTRALDQYLWLAGQYRAWRRNSNAEINAETRALFEHPPPGARADLDALLPPDQGRVRA